MKSEITQTDAGDYLYRSSKPFQLESGERLSALEVVYETWGELNHDKSNAILIHHALSVGAHVASNNTNSSKGWWQDMVGSGKPIDSDKYFVICVNNLGSCFGTSGPTTISPDTGSAYNGTFPSITIADMVSSQKLLVEELGIQELYAIVGNSMGAMLSLTWAIEYPKSVARLMLSCTSYKAYPANIANRNIQQTAIRIDPAWNNGNYTSNESLEGFKLARKLGLYTYRNSAEWNRRFNSHENKDNKDDEITRYMDYNAEKFVKIFDANSYLIITEAMDKYDVTQGYANNFEAFSRIRAKVLVVSEEYDILFTPQQQQELFDALQEANIRSEFISHHSQYGHDAFLVETQRFGSYVQKLLAD